MFRCLVNTFFLLVVLRPQTIDADQKIELSELISAIETRDGRSENMTVIAEYTRGFGGLIQAREVRNVPFTEVITTTRDGRVKYEGAGGHPNGRGEIITSHWQGAYDGLYFKSKKGQRSDEFSSGAIDNYVTWKGGFDPRELTSNYQRQAVSQRIRDSNAKIVAYKQWEGRDVVVVETEPVERNRASWKSTYWVDTDREGLVVRRSSSLRFLPDGEWQEYSFVESFDHREYGTDIWLPTRSKYVSYGVKRGQQPFVAWAVSGEGYRWKVNQDLESDFFRLEFPLGCRVYDRRGPHPEGGYQFYLAGRHPADERRANLNREPFVLSGTDMSGQEVVPETMENQVRLIFFWSTESSESLAELDRLRQLDKAYRKRGLLIVGICFDEADTVASFLDQRPVPWVTLCEVKDGYRQPTAKHYNIISVPSWILVGSDNQIASLNPKREMLDMLIEKELEAGGPQKSP